LSTIVKICSKLDFEREVGLHMMCPDLWPTFFYVIFAHFRPFRPFIGIFSTCRWSPNRREIIYYPLFADTKSIFRPLSIFKLKKTPKKCPDLWPTTVSSLRQWHLLPLCDNYEIISLCFNVLTHIYIIVFNIICHFLLVNNASTDMACSFLIEHLWLILT